MARDRNKAYAETMRRKMIAEHEEMLSFLKRLYGEYAHMDSHFHHSLHPSDRDELAALIGRVEALPPTGGTTA